METYLIAALTSFFAIFFKAISQQNVQYKRKLLILPTSWCLATCEMFTAAIFVGNFIESSLLSSLVLALVIGTAGGIGAILSLDVHQWLTKKIYKWHLEK